MGHTASAIVTVSAQPPSNPRERSSTSGPRYGHHGRHATEPGSGRTTASAITRSHGGGSRDWPCVFFPENRCRNGDDCAYTHILPDGEDARTLGKGMIGIDGRTSNPAESSGSFVFPLRGGRGGSMRGGMRGGPRGNPLGRSYGGARPAGYHGQHPSMGSGDDLSSQFGALRLDPGLAVGDDDEARRRIERFLDSTRAGRSSQRLPSVGDFPALAPTAETSLSPKSATAPLDEDLAHSAPAAVAAKLTASFASAAARGLSSAPTTTAPPAALPVATASAPATAEGLTIAASA
jgi:hypothetical protein